MIDKLKKARALGPKKILEILGNKQTRRKMRADMGSLKGLPRRIAAYTPDSICNQKLHPEIQELWEKWIYGNEDNNCGDFARFFSLILNLKQIQDRGIEGSFGELGVYKGNSAVILNHFAGRDGRKLYLFDTFDGFDQKDLTGYDAGVPKEFGDTSLEYVKKFVGRGRVTCVKGRFPESLEGCHLEDEKFAFVNLDCDLYEPMLQGLRYFYPKLSRGGVIFCHDYSSGFWQGCKNAIDQFAGEEQIPLILLPDKSGSAVIVKQ